MRRMKYLFAGFLLTLGLLCGCAVVEQSSSVPESEVSQPELEASTSQSVPDIPPEASTPQSLPPVQREYPDHFDETLEAFYDYVWHNGQISFILGGYSEETGFSDVSMAVYALCVLNQQRRYDYSVGNPREEYDAITLQYFGKKVRKFENNMTTVLPNGNITATGWDSSSPFGILKELTLHEDGSKTAIFYVVYAHMGDEWPPEEQVRRDLLSGYLEDYGPVRLFRLRFEPKQDETGQEYWKYLAAQDLGEASPPFIPYGSQRNGS